MIDVDTAPFESGPPAPNSGASNASTGVPAGTHAGHVPMVAGTNRCVDSGTNVAVPLYLMVFRVSQCPPILRRSLTLKMPPKLTANPLPVACRFASAKSVPVGTPSIPKVVPAGRPGAGKSAASEGGTSCDDRSARWRSVRRLVMYATPTPTFRRGLISYPTVGWM